MIYYAASKEGLMTRERYRHSAYWYAYHYGWTYSEARTYTGEYLDIHSYRPNIKGDSGGALTGRKWLKRRNSPRLLDSDFNPFMLGVCIAMDIGIAMRDGVRTVADPKERERVKRELMRDLRIVRRPFYYARETERRRRLAAERRKIRRRRTTAPMPTAADVMAAWNARKESREAMVRLGGMLHDLECYVDNCLRFDESGNVVGRNGGIRGWIRENLPDLFPKYKTLMRYKALAIRLRQATGTKDPTPTSALLDEPRHEVAKEVLNKEDSVFEHLFIDLEYILSPNTVLIDGTLKLGERDPSPKNKNSMRNNLGDTGIVSVSKTRRKTG